MSTPQQAEASSGKIYRRLLQYSFDQKWWLAVAIIMMVVSALSEVGFAALMKPLLDEGFVARDPARAQWAAGMIFLVFVVRAVSMFVVGYFMARIGWTVIQRLRAQLFDKYLTMPASFFDHASSGQLISGVTYTTEQVAEAATNSITLLIRDSVLVIGLLAWMLYLDWRLTLGFVVIAPIVTVIITYVTKRFRRISSRIQNSMGDVAHVTEEMVNAHRVVRIFGGRDYEREHFANANEKNRLLNIKLSITKSGSAPVVQFFVALVLIGAILFASKAGSQISAGVFVSFLTSMLMLLQPIKRLTEVNANIQKGIAAGDKIFSVLDADDEIDGGTLSVERAEGHLEFRGVGFRYQSASEDVLTDISFSVQPGQTVALVGFSGSGKSTLVNLVPRLYNPTSGQILLDRQAIDTIRLSDLRRQISYVGQEVVLFNDSIRNNIAYGELAGSSDEAIRRAAQDANAWEFIAAQSHGLDTLVGERGALLSGGQRQRLAIARALLKDAPVLILDEATAALDTQSERLIQAALTRLAANRTTLVIAHRLSTIETADMILVMDSGRIVERGRHDELLALGGAYATLHAMQFSETAHTG